MKEQRWKEHTDATSGACGEQGENKWMQNNRSLYVKWPQQLFTQCKLLWAKQHSRNTLLRVRPQREEGFYSFYPETKTSGLWTVTHPVWFIHSFIYLFQLSLQLPGFHQTVCPKQSQKLLKISVFLLIFCFVYPVAIDPRCVGLFYSLYAGCLRWWVMLFCPVWPDYGRCCLTVTINMVQWRHNDGSIFNCHSNVTVQHLDVKFGAGQDFSSKLEGFDDKGGWTWGLQMTRPGSCLFLDHKQNRGGMIITRRARAKWALHSQEPKEKIRMMRESHVVTSAASTSLLWMRK